MNKFSLLVATALTASVASTAATARDNIDIVGSSTVYPFSTVVAETFGKKTSFKTPKIESTGSGGGMKLFCAGSGINTPDITNASRRIKSGEFKKCTEKGIKLTEVKVGYDGIAIANSKKAPKYDLTRQAIFFAMAKDVPEVTADGKFTGKLVPNTYKTWDQIFPSLPAKKISVMGPPPTSGTRDAFAELAMEGGCKTVPWIKALKKKDKKKYKAICHTVREDGHYIEAGENDNLIVQKLEANPDMLGVFGFSFLDQNSDKVQGSSIDGKDISFDAIADGSYPVSRPLYMYVKNDHVGKVPGIAEFLAEFTSEEAWGDSGYLTDKGMIPMPKKERAKFATDANALKALSL
ncbi:MAG: Phosphate ABC transporter, periplasmic phosphate-binding protein PstS (TC 3.A.1.7.1) [uncultured Thiotrichaceae bacterium]|uniref:Phosphate ABC transporter, periplasmic phosphate-binding protein PstS (TC 3.A.1.7.1) n=1 Tax=uncultured Thiotrichaceae bacterium TaxID=298394 RepID=A0A6S6SQ46_9GAMM|nr:MAG: Phosphate ABC transporter, periplasmic phosphate-binding protein PstS (TC 3.A.1.7.1) [uncultured Thiotrichaceae bacterium]